MIVGIEVGGTFTDLIAVLDDGRAVIHKTPSTPDDPSRAAISGLKELLQRLGAKGGDVTELLHGSTIVANSLIQRRGAKVALLTTAGFRDVLFIQRQDKSVVYDMFYQKPTPLISRDMVFDVPERMAANGDIVSPLDEAVVIEHVDRLAAEKGVDSIAVCLLHAYANPAHERAIGDLIAVRHPDIHVSLSSEVAPEHREYERASTVVISAFMRPVVERYLSKFEADVRGVGFLGTPLIMLSNGGVAPVAAARRLVAQMFHSGPAAAVTGAAETAVLAGTPDIITIDVGGTSSDVCLITNGSPETTVKGTSEFNIEGLPLNIAMTDIISIGAGGGSMATIDAGGMLQVGPQSSGAVPGPACYNRGGERFCLTDAMLLLGLLDPATELPGGIVLDPGLSRAVAAPLCESLGLSEIELSERVYRIAAANMAQALRRVSVKRGLDPRRYALFACGGAGPLIAAAVADEVDIAEVLIPPNPGVFSAVGLSLSNVKMDYVLAEGAQAVAAMTPEILQTKLGQLRAEAARSFADVGYDVSELKHAFAVDARYRGQGYELRVPLMEEKLLSGGAAYLAECFHSEHARQYGHAFRERQVEAVSFRLSASHGRGGTVAGISHAPEAGQGISRDVTIGSKSFSCPMMRREGLAPGFEADGPLIVVEASTSTVVPPNWRLGCEPSGVLRLRRNIQDDGS
ncbi:MAG: hydantoinase/oxoprolinase family protein [Alphaproteobacteria bacterium]|nr:hydantoinase/oxoprolinase family protein [Alphaproteobacteria bacterium]MDP6255664.1 hydantoinase/oxoprolinase family protein [Alphaproteobacteria bacterium]MDP7056523.1 hydantoinase/oxoprolinase family protein [Alphaproteobacteria bacterium]MDP7229488.1 hydantoinase/oxoprolinase family protein [Alphaproteobacteria bacterium]MDP7458661.1 hydantoinase/oxoprolinase family protein [Alphaproteobacteria bacterium]